MRPAWGTIVLVASAVGCQESVAPVIDELTASLTPVVSKPDGPEQEPQLVPYMTPTPREAVVKRVGKKVRLRIAWSAVPGASAYHVQVSRHLTFARQIFDEELERTQTTLRGLKPTAYFWRVRAMGPDGASAFSRVALADATRGRKAARRAAKGGSPQDAADELPATAAAIEHQGGSLNIVWRLPADKAVLAASAITIRGFASPGALISINGGITVKSNGRFEIPVSLTHGRNRLRLQARLGKRERVIERDVFFAEPQKLGPLREKYERLRADLEEIRALKSELDGTIRELKRQIKGIKTGDMAEFQEELASIEETRTELDREVNRAIGELDAMLRR